MNIHNLEYGIQEHHSSHLHYDLRLQNPENKHKCFSWAIPKNISGKIGEKKLAIYTGDTHPMEWLYYQGTKIGSNKYYEGDGSKHYGAGNYILWDVGNYKLLEKSENKLVIEIHGYKIKHTYCLLKPKNIKNPKAWFIYRKKN